MAFEGLWLRHAHLRALSQSRLFEMSRDRLSRFGISEHQVAMRRRGWVRQFADSVPGKNTHNRTPNAGHFGFERFPLVRYCFFLHSGTNGARTVDYMQPNIGELAFNCKYKGFIHVQVRPGSRVGNVLIEALRLHVSGDRLFRPRRHMTRQPTALPSFSWPCYRLLATDHHHQPSSG